MYNIIYDGEQYVKKANNNVYSDGNRGYFI